ncbi:MAG: hypothetical protein HYY02_05040, partial [Chloroflexi bacterium]|nr:hypothetical protein [Chloroflexota bacterium]
RELGSRRPWLVTFLVAVCPFSLAMLFLGTPDAFSLLGVFVSYRSIRGRRPWLLGAGLLLAAVRPQNVLLTLPAFVLAVRHWSPGLLAKLAVPPLGVMLASLLIFGPDWPLRWVASFMVLPPSPSQITSAYGVAEILGLPRWAPAPLALALAAVMLARVWRRGLDRSTLELLLAANAAVSPYMRSVSYVVLLAIPWAGLAVRRPRLAAAAYLISLPTIATPLFWERLAILDATFPIVLLGLLVLEDRLAVEAEGRGR